MHDKRKIWTATFTAVKDRLKSCMYWNRYHATSIFHSFNIFVECGGEEMLRCSEILLRSWDVRGTQQNKVYYNKNRLSKAMAKGNDPIATISSETT